MELGEHIELHGFVEDEYGELIIAKKLIGNHVKRFMQEIPGYERLTLSLSHADGHVTVDGSLQVAGSAVGASVRDNNVFFALDRCLKELAERAIR